MTVQQFKEVEDYRKFTSPAELHKAVNTLRGLVAGITTDRTVSNDEINELSNWCLVNSKFSSHHPFSELIPKIKEIYEDGIITEEESADILWLCNNFVSDSDYYDLITSSIQFLSGLMHGVMADGEISDKEILSLSDWVRTNQYLSGCYPFDELESLILSILADGKIDEDERNILKSFFSNFIDTTSSYNLNESELKALRDRYSVEGICSICQSIDFPGSVFSFTGQSSVATRQEIAEQIESLGGIFKNNVTKKTNYLIVGNKGNPCWAYSCYGRKVDAAIKLRKSGVPIVIVNETDFWDILEDL